MTPIRATISNKENQPKLPEENKPMKQCKWAGTFWLFISQLPALLLRWGGGVTSTDLLRFSNSGILIKQNCQFLKAMFMVG